LLADAPEPRADEQLLPGITGHGSPADLIVTRITK
jgi:hypothetical protein